MDAVGRPDAVRLSHSPEQRATTATVGIGPGSFQVVSIAQQHIRGDGEGRPPSPSLTASKHQRCHRKP